MPDLATDKSVLVVGASGYFGRMLVLDLLENSDCKIVATSRSTRTLAQLEQVYSRYRPRVTTATLDLADAGSVSRCLPGAAMVVCAAGPFQELPLLLAKRCMESSIPYIDLADDRSYVLRVRKLCGELAPTSPVCCGWSSVPSLSGVMARIAVKELSTVREIFVQIAPGNRSPRGYSTVTSLLSSVGRRFSVMEDGQWTDVTGWSRPRLFRFPLPIGTRKGYLVDVADHELFPDCFGAETVEFRVGAELELFNVGLTVLGRLVNIGLVSSWRPFASLFQRCMSAFGSIGHDWGALGVEVHGTRDSAERCIRICLVADSQGQRIPVMPASVMCQRLLHSIGKELSGLIPFDSWIDRNELEDECARRGYRLLVEAL